MLGFIPLSGGCFLGPSLECHFFPLHELINFLANFRKANTEEFFPHIPLVPSGCREPLMQCILQAGRILTLYHSVNIKFKRHTGIA